MTRLMTWMAVGCFVWLQACSAEQPQSQAAEETKATTAAAAVADSGACTVVMKVDGMVCNAGCPPVVKKTLMSVAGVDEVNVSYETSLATVQASGDGCGTQAESAMVEALKSKAYTATIQSPEKKSDQQG